MAWPFWGSPSDGPGGEGQGVLAFICHCDKLCTPTFCYAAFFGLLPQFLCPTVCVSGGTTVPRGVVGDRPLVTVPQGVAGTSSLGRKDKGGEGTQSGWITCQHHAKQCYRR